MPVAFRIDRVSPVPLYFQLSQQIEQAIIDGDLRPGDRIDPEVDIAAATGLSRPTVRQAIQGLVNKGLLVRRRGVGTQVVQPPLLRSVELTSLYDDLTKARRRPSTKVLQLTTTRVDGEIAVALGLAEVAEALFIERLRLVDGEPLAVMRNWIPLGVIETSVQDLEQRGLYEIFKVQSVVLQVATQRIGADSASAYDAEALGVRKGAPLLTMQRTSLNDVGEPVEYAKHVYRPDFYSFETTIVAR
jgi:DNA-binding GntR family transcriptional regulator